MLSPFPTGQPCPPEPRPPASPFAVRALHLTIPVTDRDVTREYMAEYHPAENDV